MYPFKEIDFKTIQFLRLCSQIQVIYSEKNDNIGGLAKGGEGPTSVLAMIQKYHSKYDLKY